METNRRTHREKGTRTGTGKGTKPATEMEAKREHHQLDMA